MLPYTLNVGHIINYVYWKLHLLLKHGFLATLEFIWIPIIWCFLEEQIMHFILTEYSSILDIIELDYWRNPPNTIINTIENEISKGNYMIVYLMLSVENHRIHEFVFYGFDSEKHELYTLMLDGGKFKEKRFLMIGLLHIIRTYMTIIYMLLIILLGLELIFFQYKS